MRTTNFYLFTRGQFFLSIALLCFGLLFQGCSGQKKKSRETDFNENYDTFEEVKSNFEDPPSKYRPAPFWVWNDSITKEKIDRQLKQFKEQGMGGVFVHPRMGLITPYLSDEWHDLYEYTVEKGQEMDMKVYIYDENAFPSGFAGGHVPAEMPESVEKGHGLALHRFDTFPENAAEEFHLLLKKTEQGYQNITGKANEETGKTGSYYLFKKAFYEKDDPWHGGFSYVDLLMEGVTEKFIDITMSGYKKRFGDQFGKTVPAVFSDEANVEYPDVAYSFRWTPDLFKAFKERWGYDLKTKLPLLYDETGNWKQVRHNYYTLLGEMFVDRWAEPYSKYAEENNLLWTGHHFDHDWPKPKNGGDWLALAARQQMPGVDVLWNRYTEELEGVDTQFGNARAIRGLSSVANQMGRTRKISETYGGAGWNLTFQDMKRIADWQFALGINFLNQHLSYMTIKGARKQDYPPSFSYHEPWWNHYGELNEYHGRLSMALSSGEQINNTLVIMPTSTAWMYAAPSDTRKHINFYKRGDTFQRFVSRLEKAQVEYDLGSEAVMRSYGSVDNQNMIIGERAYDKVVLPPAMENIDKETLNMLSDYIENGGEVITYDSLPEYVNGGPSEAVKNLFANASDNQWTQADSLTLKNAGQYFSRKGFSIHRPDTISGKLFHRRLQLDDGQLLYLVNTSEDEYARGSLSINGKSVKELDAFSGNISPYPAQQKDEQMEVNFDLPPVGSLLLYIGNEEQGSSSSPSENKKSEKVIASDGDLNVDRSKPNVLTLDYVDLSIKGADKGRMYYYEAANKIFEEHGFSRGNPWYMAVQYKTNILDKNDFGKSSGFTATYDFEIGKLTGEMKDALEIVDESPRLWDVYVNGEKTEPVPGEWWLDRSFGVYNVGERVQEGNNTITLKASPMTVFSELEKVFVRGPFNLKSTSKGWKVIPEKSPETGDWTKQGLPFYSDGVKYTVQYNNIGSQDDNAEYLVRLPEWKGTVAEVEVNNEYAGIIGWPPYELDVSDKVEPGQKNTISVTVYGSLKNLLGPHHDDPIRWRVSPGMFGDGPETQPAGEKYDLINYGLYDTFELVRVK